MSGNAEPYGREGLPLEEARRRVLAALQQITASQTVPLQQALGLVRQGETPKGDLLAVARVAAIQAAKRTWELIPLCHPLPLSGMDVSIDADASLPGLVVHCRCRTTGQTGVEMEAMTAVSVGLLTIYDMLKAVDPAMTIEAIQLEFKEGGRNGVWKR